MNFWHITRKDVLLLVRDRRTLSVLVALPLAFIAILGFSTGQLFSLRERNRLVRVGMVDEDKTELAERLDEQLRKIKALEVKHYATRVEARSVLAEGQADVLLFVGPGYHERVEQLGPLDLIEVDKRRLAGRLASLDIEIEAGTFLANAAEIVRELVFSFSLRTISPELIKKDRALALRIKRLLEEDKRRTAEEGAAPADAPTLVDARPPRTLAVMVYQVLVPSYTVMFVFFIVTFMARSFISERDMGTLSRLRMAPVTRSGLLLGKTVPFVLVSLAQTILLFAAGRVLFSMSWGTQPWLLVPIMVCTSLSATALGLLVATTVRTDSQVAAYGNFLVLTMAGISGCLMPRTWQPELMQKFGLITPHAWALIAYDQILNRTVPDLTVVSRCAGMLLVFTIVYFGIGWWRFRDVE